MTIAVAPAVNLSGSAGFDPDHFADLMASELSFADGIQVVPVSRVLVVLAAQEEAGIESPEHALQVARLLGVDAVLVFAVTEYDPYDPPSIGITAQLYGQRPEQGFGRMDPVALSRRPRPAASAAEAPPSRLLAQTQRVFDASHASIVEDVREFARGRGGSQSPYGWREYVVNQREYMRFCCYATIRALLGGDGEPQDPAGIKAEG